MRIYRIVWLYLAAIVIASCSVASAEDTPPSQATQPIVTPAEPSGTIIEKAGSNLVLSHPTFQWRMELPEDWTVSYDSGYRIQAASPDQQVFVHLQAQRWKQTADRFPDARSYVEHWKDFAYGDVFPLYANGTQVAEAEFGHEKFGGPYLRFEFDDSQKGIRYVQVYASAGGPSSAMLTAWASYAAYEDANAIIQDIIDSFALTEASQ